MDAVNSQGNEVDGDAPLSARSAELAANLRAVRSRIMSAGGADLLPVTKFHPVTDLELLATHGIGAVGENREQEARAKAEHLAEATPPVSQLQIHMIGQVQTKKANHVARWAGAVHTVDSLKLVQALDRGVELAQSRGERADALPVLVQLSLDGDPSRGGAIAEDIPELADAIAASSHLELRGLMLVPPVEAEPGPSFARGRKVLEQIEDRVLGAPVYSAGMSHDLEVAIAEGSTLVRVGTDIVGPRPLR